MGGVHTGPPDGSPKTLTCPICEKQFRGEGFIVTMTIQHEDDVLGYLKGQLCSEACGMEYAKQTNNFLLENMMYGGRTGDAA